MSLPIFWTWMILINLILSLCYLPIARLAHGYPHKPDEIDTIIEVCAIIITVIISLVPFLNLIIPTFFLPLYYKKLTVIFKK